jgi:DNA-binding NtrC family response regulator
MSNEAVNQVALARRSRDRVRDRRAGLGTLVGAIAHALTLNVTPSTLRRRFELALLDVAPLRSARLLDHAPAPLLNGLSRRNHEDEVGFEVLTSVPARKAALEARVEPGCRLDPWDLQVLHGAAALGTLIIEFERLARRAARGLPVPGSRPDGAAPLIGSSLLMRALRERIERVARTSFTILIEGESGTGKELVARQIHELSDRANGPFVAINCAALVETLLEAELFGIEERTATGVRGRRGKFEHADGGTLFLDEVSDLSMTAQAKLLRAIQDLAVERVGGCGTHRINTRIVVATNRRLAELVEQGLFRPDLFYRLKGIELQVPALRTRREDILELARYFLDRHRSVRRLELSAAASDGLLMYDWPGNVRELERSIEGAVALAQSDVIELDDLPPVLRGAQADVLLPSMAAGESMRAWGSRYARLVLERCAQNKRRACGVLGISYHTLQAYLNYGAQDAPGGVAAPWPGVAGEDAWPAILAVHEGPPAGGLADTATPAVNIEG